MLTLLTKNIFVLRSDNGKFLSIRVEDGKYLFVLEDFINTNFIDNKSNFANIYFYTKDKECFLFFILNGTLYWIEDVGVDRFAKISELEVSSFAIEFFSKDYCQIKYKNNGIVSINGTITFYSRNTDPRMQFIAVDFNRKLLLEREKDKISEEICVVKDGTIKEIYSKYSCLLDFASYCYDQLSLLNNRIITLEKSCIQMKYMPSLVEVAVAKSSVYPSTEKKILIRNAEQTIERLKNSNASIVRFGDGEFRIMFGQSIPFQEYSEDLAKRLKSIFYEDIEGLLTGYLDEYYECDVNLSQVTSKFILDWFVKVHHYIEEKYINKNKTYYSSHFTSRFVEYDSYNFAEHYAHLRMIWENKDVVLVSNKNIVQKITFSIFDNASNINYIYAPPLNAYRVYEQILAECLKASSSSLLLISLGPCGKVLTYDLFKKGYRCLDIGHLLKDYDLYRKAQSMDTATIMKERQNFYKTDI